MMTEESVKLPRIPLGLTFNPYTIRRMPDLTAEPKKRMEMVKGYFQDYYKVDFFTHTRRRDYVAARSAFLCFFAKNFNEKRERASFYDVSLTEMSRIIGGFDHATALHYIRNHENNMKDFSTNYGTYYREYYKLTALIHNNMFERDPSLLEKRMLIGAL